MPHDLLIKNGLVVDGTGSRAQRADVAVTAGKIVQVGDRHRTVRALSSMPPIRLSRRALSIRTRTTTPRSAGDPLVTPVRMAWRYHRVVAGNCGIGIAPCRASDREMLMRDLVGLEAIDYDVLSKGITWEWESLPQYLDAAFAAGLRPQLGIPRAADAISSRFVMGGEATERAATAAETTEIKALLKAAVSAGAFGFSTTIIPNSMGYQGRPQACRQSSREELIAYSNALRELGKGTIQINLTKKVSIVDDEEYALLDMLLAESHRPVTLSSLLGSRGRHAGCPPRNAPETRSAHTTRRRAADFLRSSQEKDITLRAPTVFFSFRCFAPVFDRSKEEQAAIYRDGAFRDAHPRGG